MKKTFPRSLRLLSRQDYRRVYREGKRFYIGETFMVCCRFRATNRLGITIARKWGKAHERNRFKRVIREGYRQIHCALPRGLELNIHPQKNYQSLTSKQVQEALISLFAGPVLL